MVNATNFAACQRVQRTDFVGWVGVVSRFGVVEFGWGGVRCVETMCERGAQGTQPDDKKDSLALSCWPESVPDIFRAVVGLTDVTRVAAAMPFVHNQVCHFIPGADCLKSFI